MKKLSRLLLLACAFNIANAYAEPNDKQKTIYNHNATLAIESYGERDIDGVDEEETEFYLDYRLNIRQVINDDFSAYFGLKFFLPSGNVNTSEDETSFTDEAYLEAREFWIRYHGISDYDKEYLTIGRQRFKEETGLWFNRDIESIRWQLDTTTYFYSLGLLKAFDTYRTNDDELVTDIEDRTYLYGEVGYWVNASTRIGSRLIIAKDSNDTSVGNLYTGNKRSKANYNWLSGYISSDYFNYNNPKAFNYWVSVSLLSGDRDTFSIASDNKVTAKSNIDVSAWSLNSAVRWKPIKNNSLNLGFLLNAASGGIDGDTSNQFEQTGLQSNSGRYTGTSQKIRVLSESYRAELSNLMAFGLFASYHNDTSSLSVLLNSFSLTDNESAAPNNSLRANNVTNSKDLGQSIDVYWNYYFSHSLNTFLKSSRIRTIVSYFKTGEYYEVNDSYFTVKLAWNWRH